MTRIRELMAEVKSRHPKDQFFADFEASYMAIASKRRQYQSYDRALRFLDADAWAILKEKALRHFLDHRKGQLKQDSLIS